MSLQGNWPLDAAALGVGHRRCMRLLAALGVILSVAGFDGSLPAPAGLALAALTIALAVLIPVLARCCRGVRASRSALRPVVVKAAQGGLPALGVDSVGRVVDPPSPVATSTPYRPVRWYRGRRHLWIAMRDAHGVPTVLSGRLPAADDASAARLDAWLVWLRRGPRG